MTGLKVVGTDGEWHRVTSLAEAYAVSGVEQRVDEAKKPLVVLIIRKKEEQ